MTDNSEIRILIGRFLDGETSVSDEIRLYELFQRPDLPPELESYRSMMQWYASLSATPQSAKPRIRLKPFYIAAAAAVTAIVVSLATLSVRQSIKERDYFAQYEGSYMISNGKKITDVRTVLAEAEKFRSDLQRRNVYSTPQPPDPAEILEQNIDPSNPVAIQMITDFRNDQVSQR